jgi:hypothetical protein
VAELGGKVGGLAVVGTSWQALDRRQRPIPRPRVRRVAQVVCVAIRAAARGGSGPVEAVRCVRMCGLVGCEGGGRRASEQAAKRANLLVVAPAQAVPFRLQLQDRGALLERRGRGLGRRRRVGARAGDRRGEWPAA